MTLRFETLPPSTNHLYRRTSRGVSMLESVRQAKDDIAWEARSQFRGDPLQGPLAVTLDLYWPDRRKHDVDNVKALLDALNSVVWEDDGQIVDLHIRKHFDKADPRVELEIILVGDNTSDTH